MRISDWSSDVCSSDLDRRSLPLGGGIVQSFLKVMELCTAITRLFTARNQVLNGVAAPFGLTAVQVMALHHISAAPACTPSTLARSLAVDSASVTRLLDRLEHKDMNQRAAQERGDRTHDRNGIDRKGGG